VVNHLKPRHEPPLWLDYTIASIGADLRVCPNCANSEHIGSPLQMQGFCAKILT
jgi:hypothetical protein